MEIGIRQAKAKLSTLVSRALQGDERIFLTNHGKRVVELVPVKPIAEQPPHRGLGMYKDVPLPPGFGSQVQRRRATKAVLDQMGLGEA